MLTSAGAPPIAPTEISVIQDGNHVKLTWVGGSDNALGFLIERKEMSSQENVPETVNDSTGENQFSDEDEDWEILDTISQSDLREFVDKTVEKQKKYIYRVSAYSGSGFSAPVESEQLFVEASIFLRGFRMRTSPNIFLLWTGASSQHVDVYKDGEIFTSADSSKGRLRLSQKR